MPLLPRFTMLRVGPPPKQIQSLRRCDELATCGGSGLAAWQGAGGQGRDLGRRRNGPALRSSHRNRLRPSRKAQRKATAARAGMIAPERESHSIGASLLAYRARAMWPSAKRKLGSFLDRVQIRLRHNVQHAASDDRRAAHRLVHLNARRLALLLTMLKHENVTVLGPDVNLPIDPVRRTPNR